MCCACMLVLGRREVFFVLEVKEGRKSVDAEVAWEGGRERDKKRNPVVVSLPPCKSIVRLFLFRLKSWYGVQDGNYLWRGREGHLLELDCRWGAGEGGPRMGLNGFGQ